MHLFSFLVVIFLNLLVSSKFNKYKQSVSYWIFWSLTNHIDICPTFAPWISIRRTAWSSFQRKKRLYAGYRYMVLGCLLPLFTRDHWLWGSRPLNHFVCGLGHICIDILCYYTVVSSLDRCAVTWTLFSSYSVLLLGGCSLSKFN